MKNKIIWLVVLVVFCFSFMVGCSEQQPSNDKNAYVVLEEREGISLSKNNYTVNRGGDVSIDFTLNEGYLMGDFTYNGEYELTNNGNSYTLKLKNVKYDTRVIIDTQRIISELRYYLNGGSFLDESKQGDYYVKNAVATNRVRVNTDIGTEIYRERHTLIGWNNKADGSGEHIGLGSRLTVGEDVENLYAQWAEWSPDEWFVYGLNHDTRENGDIILESYQGETVLERLVIPAEIDGKKVSYIGADFSDGLKIKTLILPNTINTLKIGCFKNSDIEEIYFYDNIAHLSDGCFDGTIKTVYINAILAPRYIDDSNKAVFAEVMDRIILNADKKKMIFYAGCSMNYGLDSKMVDEAFNYEYVVCDIGVIGSINSTFQLDCITKYINEGDIFIHAPEQMSPYQLMDKLRSEERVFMCVEGNYDLLRLADCREMPGFFETFEDYNRNKLMLPACSYEDYYFRYNEYGDDTTPRPNSPENSEFGIDILFKTKYLTEYAFSNLNKYYARIADKGAEVLFSFAPINVDAMSEEEEASNSWVTFENMIREGLDSRYKVISTATDYMMAGKYFYDTDYHLSTEGAILRTEMLIRDLKAVL